MPDFSFPDETGNDANDKTIDVQATEVEIVDDTPEADRGRRPMTEPPKDVTDEELSKYDESVKKRIQHFSKGYHEERRAKEAAQRERDEALSWAQNVVNENRKLQGSLVDSQNLTVTAAKQAVEAELATAKRKLREANEAFDAEAATEAQDLIVQARLKLDKIENFKPAPVQREENVVQTPQVSKQPQKLDDRLVEWKDQNKWFGTKRSMTNYALGVHEDLKEEGVAVGSKNYYERLDAEMRTRFPEEFEADDAVDANPPPRRAQSAVASATRSVAPKKITLKKSQVELARKLGVPLEVYARNVAQLERN